MPVDMKLLKSRGISSASYKRIFSGPAANYPPRVKKLVDLIANRARRGRTLNLQEWRAYAAIDLAYDVSFKQTTPTLVQHVLSGKYENATQLLEAARKWGLNDDELFLKVKTAGGDTALVPNPPVFYQILIPLVKAVVTTRLAKIFNERNLPTLLLYEPLKETERNQVLCEVITDIVNTIAGWYGYSETLKQCIHQMLKYGTALTFPYEEWHVEEQEYVDEEGEPDKDGKRPVRLQTIKEGLRYHIPHPTQMFYDLQFPLTTINSDTGTAWCGHWNVTTYGDILDNREYWNRKSIFSGTNWFSYPDSSYYWQELFPCVMADAFGRRFPGGWERPMNREEKSAWYNNSDRDQAVFLTQFFIKLVPADWGLGEYDGKATEQSPIGKLTKTYHYPVWHRFTLAGDDTVVWAGPCAYTPSWFMGYHYDQTAGRNSSLALDALPYQDQLTMMLSQIILTAKQNLENVTFYDKNLVSPEDITRLKNLGESKYRGRQYIPYDSLNYQKLPGLGGDMSRAFFSPQLQKQSIVELLQALPIVLNIMERVLQISAQEVGAAASHQQSKAEVGQTGAASSNGVVFTSSAVDAGIDAWKKQLYDAVIAYLDPEFTAQVSADIPDLEKHLAELGFEMERSKMSGKVLVTGHKKHLRLEGFASCNEGPRRETDKEASQVISSTTGVVAGQPDLFKKVGAKNILKLLEEAARLAGAPRDFSLDMPPDDGKADDEVPEAVQKAIATGLQTVMQAVEQKLAQPIAKEMADEQQKIAQLEQLVKQLTPIAQAAQALQDKNAIAAQKLQASIEQGQVKTQAAIERSREKTQADIQNAAAKTQADIELERAKTEHGLQLAGAEAQHGLSLKTATAAHGAALAQAAAAEKPAAKGE